MRLQDLRHWQWALIGLIFGAILGTVHRGWAEDPEINFYNRSISERVLEERLATPNPATGSHPYFHSLVVRPYGSGQMLIARSMERDNRPNLENRTADGKRVVHYIEKTVIVLPKTGVYVPATQRFATLAENSVEVRITLTQTPDEEKLKELASRGFKQTSQPKPNVLVGTIAPRNARELASLADISGVKSILPTDPANTIRGFLDKVKEKYPEFSVSYEYAWWSAPNMQFMLWTMGGLVIVGGIWPFIVNLIAFGQLRHPPSETASIRLRPEPAPVPAKSKEKEQPEVDVAAIEAQIAKLEANLGDFGKQAAPVEEEAEKPAESAPVIRKLAAGPLDGPVVFEKPREQKEYGGEFYPTVAHAPRKKD